MFKALYRQHWNVELDLRTIKTPLGLEPLRCKTPERARKELWVSLLADKVICQNKITQPEFGHTTGRPRL